jgi:hypothetical protein
MILIEVFSTHFDSMEKERKFIDTISKVLDSLLDDNSKTWSFQDVAVWSCENNYDAPIISVRIGIHASIFSRHHDVTKWRSQMWMICKEFIAQNFSGDKPLCEVVMYPII